MHSWKSIHVSGRDGLYRLIMVSLITILLSFVLLYSVAHTFVEGVRLNDQYFSLFLLSLFILYPIHKLLHLLPLKMNGISCRLVMKKHGRLKIRFTDPVTKIAYMISLIFPFVTIKIVGVIFIVLVPEYFHYTVLLLALHTGLCVEDFIYLKNIFRTPKSCLIDETEDSLEILIVK